MSLWSKAKSRVKKTYAKAKTAVTSAYTRAVKGVSSAVKTASNYVVKGYNTAKSVVGSATKAVGNAIKNTAVNTYNSVKSLFFPSSSSTSTSTTLTPVPSPTPQNDSPVIWYPPTQTPSLITPSNPTIPSYIGYGGTGSGSITSPDPYYFFDEGASGGYSVGDGSAVDGSLQFGGQQQDSSFTTALISGLLTGAVFFILK